MDFDTLAQGVYTVLMPVMPYLITAALLHESE